MINKYIPIVFLFAAVLLIPGGAFASNDTLNSNDPEQYDNYNDNDNDTYRDGNKLEPDFEDLPNPMDENIETNQTVLKEAHSKLTQLMIAMDNDTEEFDDNFIYIPYTATYIDDDVLVVGISPNVLLIDWPIYERDIINQIGIDVPIQIKYLEFVPETKEFTPYQSEEYITEGARGSPRTDMPCDSSGSLHCYYYKLLKQKCDAGINDRRANTYKRILSGAGWDANALCNGQTNDIIEGLVAEIRGKAINVSWNMISEPVSKLTVTTYKDNRQVDKDTVQGNSFIVYNFVAGAQYKFKVDVLTRDGTSESKTSKSVGVQAGDYTVTISSKILPNGNIKVSWNTPDDISKYKLYVEKDNGRKQVLDKLSSSATSYTYTSAEPGHIYKFKLKVYYTVNTAQYGSSEYFETRTLVVPLNCEADQHVLNYQCVDRCTASNEKWNARQNMCVVASCPAGEMIQNNRCVDRCQVSNEEWRNNMCTVTSCPTGKVIKNNACVTPTKPIVIIPPVVNQTSVMSTNGTTITPIDIQCNTGSSTRESGDACEGESFDADAYYESRTNDRILSGGDIISYVYQYSNPAKLDSQQGTITIGATLNGENGFVTAAHTFIPENTDNPRQQRIFEDGTGSRTDVITTLDKVYSNEDIRGKSADATFIPIGNEFTISTDTLTDHMDQPITIVEKGGLTLPVDTPIQMLNITHTIPGTIKMLDVTIRDEPDIVNGTIVNHQILGDYSSKRGNSGAPIITVPEDGNARLIGVHTGKLCQYLSTDNLMSSWAPNPNNCAVEWKVISPWEGVVGELGIDE